MPQGVLPLGQDLLPRQTMNNIVAALCQEGPLTEASPAVKAGAHRRQGGIFGQTPGLAERN